MIPIYVRVTIDGQRAEFGLHKSIKDDQWDKRKGCFKGYSKEAKKLNSYLDLVKSKIRQQSFRLILSQPWNIKYVIIVLKIEFWSLGKEDAVSSAA